MKAIPWLNALIMSLLVFACSDSQSGSPLLDNGTPHPRPTDPHAVLSQLKRFVGQEEFVNLRTVFPYRRMETAKAASSSSRDIQESDVFKVGRPGSKLLYLLNDYRGLQVVSFAGGADHPELIGRVEATGNFPNNMYLDPTRERIIVLERNWMDVETQNTPKAASRILVYDVSNPELPHVIQNYDVAGDIADSRLVGNVLYLALAEWPDGRGSEGKGHIISYQLADAGLTLKAQHELKLPVNSQEDLNIVETKTGDQARYYLIAHLSESRWSFWDRRSTLEVVDISDANGVIQPVMLVTAKGVIRERSATHIKDDTLVVVSNYTVKVGETNVLRAALETFTFPTAGATAISHDEATYRRLHIERAMEHVPAGTDPEKYREVLLASPTLGLKGQFVNDGKGPMEKLIADGSVTTGDTTGLSANIRDVRFSGDYAYVFWVPQTMVDPLDVFDLKNVREAPIYRGRTFFEGWIERSMPITFKQQEFILGLGWTISTEGSTQQRIPQAALFRIDSEGPNIAAHLIEQINLKESKVWINFNAPDKFVEIRLTGDGQGVALFQISSWGGTFGEGGKLLSFDLNNAAQGAKVFTEGGVLAAEASWLKRVFTNPEIDHINTFSNQRLGVFASNERHIGAPGEVMSAIASLELARNLVAYKLVGKDGQQRGLQVITTGNAWDHTKAQTTELRLVDPAKADSDEAQVLAKLSLPGSYLTDAETREGLLLVLTKTQKYTESAESSQLQTKIHINLLALGPEAKTLSLVASKEWAEDDSLENGGSTSEFLSRMPWWPRPDEWQLSQLHSGQIIAAHNSHLHGIMTPTGELSGSEVKLGGACVSSRIQNLRLHEVSAQLYASYYENVAPPDEKHKDLLFIKNFEAPLREDNLGVTCTDAVNVPGALKAVTKEGHWVTEDNRVIDIIERPAEENSPPAGVPSVSTYHEIKKAPVFVSLRRHGRVAKLYDLYAPETGRPNIFDGGDRGLIVLEAAPSENEVPRLAVLNLDPGLRFTKESYPLDPEVFRGWQDARLIGIFSRPASPSERLGIVTHRRWGAVIAWTTTTPQPVVRPVAVLQPDFSRAKPSSLFSLPGSHFWQRTGTNERPSFDPTRGSFVLNQGWWGLRQVDLAE